VGPTTDPRGVLGDPKGALGDPNGALGDPRPQIVLIHHVGTVMNTVLMSVVSQ